MTFCTAVTYRLVDFMPKSMMVNYLYRTEDLSIINICPKFWIQVDPEH